MAGGHGKDGVRIGVGGSAPRYDLVRPDQGEWGQVQLARLGRGHIDYLEIEPAGFGRGNEIVRGGRCGA